jgi:hypothetical protein
MFCPWCQQTRSADTSPCPRCNTSSPLLDSTTYYDFDRGGPVTATWQETSEQITYVAPIYKRVHPLTSRKRAISGLLSIILVVFLLCIWAGQNSSTSKQVEEFSRLVLGKPPASLQQTGALLIHDPKREPDRGPAIAIISSATTTGRLDPKTHIAVSSEQIFQPNQPVYLTYTVKPTQKGTVTIKWYTNKIMYEPSDIKVDPVDGNIANGYSEMLFVQPVEGYVELYWNNKLAQRLYFAVRT